MLSMLEKIKANAATLSKPPLGEAPLNLSAMLDNGHNKQNGSEGSSGNSGEFCVHSSVLTQIGLLHKFIVRN